MTQRKQNRHHRIIAELAASPVVRISSLATPARRVGRDGAARHRRADTARPGRAHLWRRRDAPCRLPAGGAGARPAGDRRARAHRPPRRPAGRRRRRRDDRLGLDHDPAGARLGGPPDRADRADQQYRHRRDLRPQPPTSA
ncbi:MAG: hypothetical protein WDO24_25770 [Pseudomonadota bacterium]